MNLDRFGLRGEVAYTFTEDNEGTDPFVKNSFLYLVLGADRSFFEHLNVNIQTIYTKGDEFSGPQVSAESCAPGPLYPRGIA